MKMVPMDPSEEHGALGNITVNTFDDKGNKIENQGSAVKIGASCVLTTNHALYSSVHQQMSPGNKGAFDKEINFISGSGQDKKVIKASVFFQMTKEGTDYTVKNGERVFYGHHDLVLLKLDNYSDPYFKKVNVVSPSQVTNKQNVNLGTKMTCQGSPYYKTSKTYGACKGEDYKWKHEGARVFEDDTSARKGGMAANVASGPSMSGGPCYLDNNPNEVFALVSNGFHGDDPANPTLPDLEFNGNYAGGDARYLALLHILDKRLKAELKFGLDKISEYCK